MKREANQLITPIDNLLVAQTAGHGQRQIVLFRLVHKMQHPIQKISDFRDLSIQTLRQQHGELGGVHFKAAPNHSGVHTL